MTKTKRIALVAHDSRKQDLLDWVKRNELKLKAHQFCGTGTTAKLISEHTKLQVDGYLSGPLGGDMQIGSRIVENAIDMMIFFWDPLAAQPHDPDVKALLRIAVLYDIPTANNIATADFLLRSELMDESYQRVIIDYSTRIKRDD
jgi:methylglyoxal synthase